MPTVGKSAKLYQERRQPYLRETLRGPGPNLNLEDNAAHDLPLEPPLPSPPLIQPKDCAPANDSGQTQYWPHGDKTAP